MQVTERYNKVITGVISGIVMPVIAFLIFFLFTRNGLPMVQYLERVAETGKTTEVMSVAVFSNILIFLLFNRFDMLQASKGVLGITFIWAFIVFGIKLF
jgi:heme/copper-type cytochrome/quinol oxidase subunit 2